MYQDVASLLKECLKKYGKMDLANTEFDSQSTITIDLENRLSINIGKSPKDENIVMFWCNLGDANYSRQAEALLSQQSEVSSDHFYVGQPALCKGKNEHGHDVLELCGELRPHCLTSADNFSAALETFFECLTQTQDKMK